LCKSKLFHGDVKENRSGCFFLNTVYVYWMPCGSMFACAAMDDRILRCGILAHTNQLPLLVASLNHVRSATETTRLFTRDVILWKCGGRKCHGRTKVPSEAQKARNAGAPRENAGAPREVEYGEGRRLRT